MKEITLPSVGQIIDSHAHVVKEYFAEDQTEVIGRALDSGIVQMVNPGVVLTNVPELIELAEKYAHIFTSVGLHPHEAKDWTDESERLVRETAKHKKVVAIGECGLDFFYNNSEPSVQKAVLEKQVDIALAVDKPIIIHCRDAWDEAFEILERAGKGKLRGVFHCYTGGPELLERIEKLDFYVSFSGIVTFPKSKEIQEAAKLVKMDRILAETDCPFLAPQKVRGKRNEPSYVWFVAEKLAELRGVSVESIASACRDNARALFRLPII